VRAKGFPDACSTTVPRMMAACSAAEASRYKREKRIVCGDDAAASERVERKFTPMRLDNCTVYMYSSQ
jgi:hypothetical protein